MTTERRTNSNEAVIVARGQKRDQTAKAAYRKYGDNVTKKDTKERRIKTRNRIKQRPGAYFIAFGR